MKLRVLAAALAAMTLTAGVAGAQDMTSEKGRLSYYFGYDFARSLAESGEPLDVATVVKAVQDGLAKKDPAIKPEQLKPAVEAWQKRQQAKVAAEKAKWDKAASDNQGKSTQFISQYKAQAGVKTLPNGVAYKVLENGSGAKPSATSTLALQVGGPYPYGGKQEGDQPQQVPSVKMSEIDMPVIREVLAQMPAGSRWEVAVPPEKAFGNRPGSGFPPNVAVVFDIKLVSVK